MDELENLEFDIEDILREFGSEPKDEPPEVPPAPEPQPEPEPEEDVRTYIPRSAPKAEPAQFSDTVRIDTIPREETPAPVADNFSHTRRWAVTDDLSDTRRWDGAQLTGAAQPVDDFSETRRFTPQQEEPYTDKWEPEYEQPMGNYVPPQPIAFKPRSPIRELKRKLVVGPEKRYYALSEKGLSKLQAAIFLSLLVVLISAYSTGMYALSEIPENRLRLMVFIQFMAMLLSALLCSFQLIEGVADVFQKRFTLNTLLAVTFIVCCVDGVLCLQQVRVPCCSAFSLQATMSLWSAYQRRGREIFQMDTLRRANHLIGVRECADYYEGTKGLLQTEGQLEDFLDNYARPGKPERQLNLYALISMGAAFAIGIIAGVRFDFSVAVQVTAVALLAAVPATAFVCQSRPAWILERRLHKLGTVLCGWQGVEGLCGKAVFPIGYKNLFSQKGVRLNGMKFFGNREPGQVVAYAAAMIIAEENGLSPIFSQVLDSHNGKHYDAFHLYHYENGGLGGVVNGEVVLMGSASFMRNMDIAVPDSAKLKQAIYVAIEGELSCLFAISYEKSKTTVAGLSTLTSYKNLTCVMTSDDFMLTHGFIYNKFGIKSKRLLMPDWEVRKQLRQQPLPEDAPNLLLTVNGGLSPLAYGVTGARMLKKTCRMGTALHITGGLVGLAIILTLVFWGGLELLTPVNMFLYQLVWMIPALLITEWTRTI